MYALYSFSLCSRCQRWADQERESQKGFSSKCKPHQHQTTEWHSRDPQVQKEIQRWNSLCWTLGFVHYFVFLYIPSSGVWIFYRCVTVECSCVFTGVNLLVGTESGLWLLDRSGQGKVYSLISRRRFQQMDVLEGLNVLITISGTRTINLIYGTYEKHSPFTLYI